MAPFIATALFALAQEDARIPGAETIGTEWDYLGTGSDRGLPTYEFNNRNKNRTEAWHLRGIEWFVQSCDGVYMLATKTEGGAWITRPTELLVYVPSTKWKAICSTALGLIMCGIGSMFGIATGGWGIPATVPFTLWGITMGYMIGDVIDGLCGKWIRISR